MDDERTSEAASNLQLKPEGRLLPREQALGLNGILGKVKAVESALAERDRMRLGNGGIPEGLDLRDSRLPPFLDMARVQSDRVPHKRSLVAREVPVEAPVFLPRSHGNQVLT